MANWMSPVRDRGREAIPIGPELTKGDSVKNAGRGVDTQHCKGPLEQRPDPLGINLRNNKRLELPRNFPNSAAMQTFQANSNE